MASFCKKTFFLPFLSPRKLNKASFPNALRPDCPSRKFREQQNYSENSESAEGTEGTESTEDPEDPEDSELTAFRIACQIGQAFLPAFLDYRPGRPVRRGPAGPHQHKNRVGHHPVSVQ